MWTKEKLLALSPEERTRAFDDLVLTLYPEEVGRAEKVMRDLDQSRGTWHNWHKRHNVPVMAILLLQEWTLAETDPRTELRTWGTLVDQVAEVTDRLAELTRTLRQMAADRDAWTAQARTVAAGRPRRPETPRSAEGSEAEAPAA